MLVKTHNALDFYFILWQFKRIRKSFPCVYVWWKGLQKQGGNKLMNQLGHWNGHWDCGTDKEKLQVALFSTKLFTEESFFFFKVFFFFSQMKAPDNLWFVAFQPSGVFKSRENGFIYFFLLSIDTCSLLYRSWNDKCQLLHFLKLPYSFFFFFYQNK